MLDRKVYVPERWLDRCTLAAFALLVCAAAPSAVLAQPAPQVAPQRRQLILQLPKPEFDEAGELILQPNVTVHSGSGAPTPLAGSDQAALPSAATGQEDSQIMPAGFFAARRQSERKSNPEANPLVARHSGAMPHAETLPPAAPASPPETVPAMSGPVQDPAGASSGDDHLAEPIFEHLVEDGSEGTEESCCHCGPLAQFRAACHSNCGDGGVGRERVMLAPFEVDITQPFKNFKIRVDSAFNMAHPDRAEYFWARSSAIGGRGPPKIERSISYQEVHLVKEFAVDNFSTIIDVPIRGVNPEINNNSSGLSDVSIATKLVLLQGERWQFTQYFRTIMNSGLARRGLGTGHVSLEPGFLLRYKVNAQTYLHGQLKYWFPIAGNVDHSGGILELGLAASRVLYENDGFAIIPTFEVLSWGVMDGQQTYYPSGALQDADGQTIVNLAPGVRTVYDTGCVFGLFEMGANVSLGVTGKRWHDALFRFELRWSY